MHARVTILSLILGACLTAGCSERDGLRSEFLTLPDVEARRVRTLELIRVAQSSSEIVFSGVGAVDVDSKGYIYVGDHQNGEVVVLSPDGDFVRKVGRRGDGPGEFQQLTTIQILAGDSLLVFDARPQRITAFAPDSGEIAYLHTLADNQSEVRLMFARRALTEPAYLGVPVYLLVVDPNEGAQQRQIVRLLRSDGSIIRDSLVTLPVPEILAIVDGGMRRFSSAPTGRHGIFRFDSADRIYTAWTDTLGVSIYSLEGIRIGGFQYDFTGPPVTQRDLDEIVSAIEAKVGGGLSSRCSRVKRPRLGRLC